MAEEPKEILKRRDAKKLKPSRVRQVSDSQMLEIDRQARAYGWEIGRGRSMDEKIDASPDNPFLDPDWRDKHSLSKGL